MPTKIKPYEVALGQYGTVVLAGNETNPRIEKYFDDIGAGWVDDDETAWCAAFVQWCLKQAGLPYSSALNARSFLTYGTDAVVPALGDIVVLWRISKVGPYGHVGFVVKQTAHFVYILGGNQSEQVNITKFPLTQLLAYRHVPA